MKITGLFALIMFSGWLQASENFFESGSLKTDSQSQLRTLFTSSQQRQQLDAFRKQGMYRSQPQSTASIIKKPISVRMQGLVLRKHKKPVIFINDTNNLKSSRIDNQVSLPTYQSKINNLKIPVRIKQKNIKLKPGQQWQPSSNLILDKYQIESAKNKTSRIDNSTHTSDNLAKPPSN